MRIAVLSDTHVAARAPAFDANLEVCLAWIRESRPDQVIHLGDITADGLRDREELRFAQQRLGGLALPLRVLPGNHDIGDNPPHTGDGDKDAVDPARLTAYRDTFGADHWSLELAGWQLIGLNCLLFTGGSEDEAQQWEWLRGCLEGSRAPLGLLLHKPLFRSGPEDREQHERYVPWQARDRLLALTRDRDLRFVMSGHAHQARRFTVGGTEHIWMPSTAFCIPDAVQEPLGDKVVALGLLTLEPEAHRFERVSPPGLIRHNVLDHADVYPEVGPIREAMQRGGDPPR